MVLEPDAEIPVLCDMVCFRATITKDINDACKYSRYCVVKWLNVADLPAWYDRIS